MTTSFKELCRQKPNVIKGRQISVIGDYEMATQLGDGLEMLNADIPDDKLVDPLLDMLPYLASSIAQYDADEGFSGPFVAVYASDLLENIQEFHDTFLDFYSDSCRGIIVFHDLPHQGYDIQANPVLNGKISHWKSVGASASDSKWRVQLLYDPVLEIA